MRRDWSGEGAELSSLSPATTLSARRICFSLVSCSARRLRWRAVLLSMWAWLSRLGIFWLQPRLARGQATRALGHTRWRWLSCWPCWRRSPHSGQEELSVTPGSRLGLRWQRGRWDSQSAREQTSPQWGHSTRSCRISLLAMLSGKMSARVMLVLSWGQVLPSPSQLTRQEWQNLWPQTVCWGSLWHSRQMAHSNWPGSSTKV